MKRIQRASRARPPLVAMFARVRPAAIIGGALALLMVVAVMACDTSFPFQKTTPEPPSVGEGMAPESTPLAPLHGPSPVPQQTLMAWSTVPPAGTPTAQAPQGVTPLPTTVALGGEGTPTGTAVALEGEAALPPGALGALLIPKSGLSVPVFAVSWKMATVEGEQIGQWQWAAEGIGYHLGTAWPGTQGNCVLSLGPGATQAQGQVAELALGDQIEALFGENRAVYTVVAINRVRETGAPLAERRAHAAYMDPSEDARLTLILCWPGWACTHRQILVAKRL